VAQKWLKSYFIWHIGLIFVLHNGQHKLSFFCHSVIQSKQNKCPQFVCMFDILPQCIGHSVMSIFIYDLTSWHFVNLFINRLQYGHFFDILYHSFIQSEQK